MNIWIIMLYINFKFVKKFNLSVFDYKTPNAQGGSLRVYTSNNRNAKIRKSVKKQIIKEKNIFNLFNKILKSLRTKL